MQHFDSVIDVPGANRTRTIQPHVTVTETVKVTQKPIESRGFTLRDAAAWDWSDLRDYVVTQIESKFGPQPRDSKKEYGIFNRFIKTYGGEKAAAIARYAFEVEGGWWMSAPIGVNRFTRGCDPYFAEVILGRL